MTAALQVSDDAHAWAFTEQRITQLCVDPASCRLESWTLQASFIVRIGVPFQYSSADGTSRRIDPENPVEVAPLLALVGTSVDSLIVTRAGSLALTLSDGSSLAIDSHPTYEAFEVQGGGALEGMGYLASPGGGPPWGRSRTRLSKRDDG